MAFTFLWIHLKEYSNTFKNVYIDNSQEKASLKFFKLSIKNLRCQLKNGMGNMVLEQFLSKIAKEFGDLYILLHFICYNFWLLFSNTKRECCFSSSSPLSAGFHWLVSYVSYILLI